MNSVNLAPLARPARPSSASSAAVWGGPSRRHSYLMPPRGRPHSRVGPMIRMALTHAVRRGLAASIHTQWRRENLVAGGEGDEAVPPAPPAGGPPPGFMPLYLGRWHLWPRRHSWRPLWRGRLNACGMMAASGRGYVLGASYLSLYSRSRSRCSCVVVKWSSSAGPTSFGHPV